jgi:hypothetical protein
MKARIFILTAAIVVLTMFSPAKAKAWGFFPPSKPVCPKEPTTTLPIDSNVVFLMIAGMVMGVAMVKKSNPVLKPALIKL